MNKSIRSSIYLLLATIIWGSAFVSQSVGMDHISPYAFQAIRCLIAVVGLLPIIAISDTRKNDGKTFFSRWTDAKLWKAGLLCGIPLFLACNLQQVGLVDTDAGKSGFLTAMYIIIVPILGLFRKRKITIMTPISVLLAAVGLYFLSCIGTTTIQLGDLVLMGCAVMFAVQITFVDIFADNVDALRLNSIQALVCSVLSCIPMLFTELPTWETISACWIPLLHTGLLSMGIAYALQILGQRNIEPTAASLIMSLESVFAVIFGAIILKETMSMWEILGCIIMFVAVILSQLSVNFKKKVRS